MTTIEVFHQGEYITGFCATGHTGYGEEGEDIVCAAVSAITQTALLGLQKFVPDIQSRIAEGDEPILSVRLKNPCHDSEIILQTMVCGLEDILAGVPQFVRVLHHRTEMNTK